MSDGVNGGPLDRLHRPRRALLPRLLFWATCAASAGLLALVAAAPPLTRRPGPGPRWLALFASDAAVRRTAVASALGLLVTASIFFRPPPPKRRRPRPPGSVGA